MYAMHKVSCLAIFGLLILLPACCGSCKKSCNVKETEVQVTNEERESGPAQSGIDFGDDLK